ncbi:MAG: hypothetical protein LLG20_22515 [Acidobacteriales bacterium]|nr:hypothetical protein [Terriglobales bacterium]
MSKRTDEVCELINRLNDQDKCIVLDYLRRHLPLHPLEKEWGTTADAILTAIARSSDLTQRGIRGILAEAVFEERILPPVLRAGWQSVGIVGDQAYDFVLESSSTRVQIQVKLQRKEKGVPKEYAKRSRDALVCPSGKMYVVEVQKTRSGHKNGEKTRPYRFGDFDILAVNMQPSTGDWDRFAFTVGSWLLPCKEHANQIEIFQPVPEHPDDFWTHDLATCISWFRSGIQKRLYSENS